MIVSSDNASQPNPPKIPTKIVTKAMDSLRLEEGAMGQDDGKAEDRAGTNSGPEEGMDDEDEEGTGDETEEGADEEDEGSTSDDLSREAAI